MATPRNPPRIRWENVIEEDMQRGEARRFPGRPRRDAKSVFVSPPCHSLLDYSSIRTTVFSGNHNVRRTYFAAMTSMTLLARSEPHVADLKSCLNRFNVLLLSHSSLDVCPFSAVHCGHSDTFMLFALPSFCGECALSRTDEVTRIALGSF